MHCVFNFFGRTYPKCGRNRYTHGVCTGRSLTHRLSLASATNQSTAVPENPALLSVQETDQSIDTLDVRRGTRKRERMKERKKKKEGRKEVSNWLWAVQLDPPILVHLYTRLYRFIPGCRNDWRPTQPVDDGAISVQGDLRRRHQVSAAELLQDNKPRNMLFRHPSRRWWKPYIQPIAGFPLVAETRRSVSWPDQTRPDQKKKKEKRKAKGLTIYICANPIRAPFS